MFDFPLLMHKLTDMVLIKGFKGNALFTYLFMF